MPAVQCPGCKAHISIPSLHDCPRCKAPLPSPLLSKPMPASPQTIYAPGPAFLTTGSEPQPTKKALVILGLGAILLCAGLLIYNVVFPSAEKLRQTAISKALTGCQFAIKSLAQYGDADMPPYVPNQARSEDDEYYFAWPRGSFEFTNGFGAKEKMSASCIGKLSTGEIAQLTLNGQTIK